MSGPNGADGMIRLLRYRIQQSRQQRQMHAEMDASTASGNSFVSNGSTQSAHQQFQTIPFHGNLEESLSVMTEEQINLNLIEINLVAMFNPKILDKLYDWSLETKFYLKNRYLLESILNVTSKTPASKKKNVKDIVERYDTVYVNGKPHHSSSKDSHIIKLGLRKEKRAKFISCREEFVTLLEELSESLKQKEKVYEDPEDLKEYFRAELQKINHCQVHASISPNKLSLVNSASMESVSSQDSGELEEISNSSIDTPKKQKQLPIFSMLFHEELHEIKSIRSENSRYVRTKNRFPLILDFHFARFIYKNDDQLSHELIAMSIIKYLNRILTVNLDKPQIVEYEIMPEAIGAFYEFVEHSKTVGKIKEEFAGGIPDYLNYLEKQAFQDSVNQISPIRKRFAETYAGFCTLQYLLDLKDRNNENIMIRSDGSIFHIDLAFIFNANPGNFAFESSPFKFPKEYLDAMGGFDSDTFKYYESLMMSNMTRLCTNKEELLSKIGIMCARKDEIACFRKYKIETFKNKIPKKPSHVREKVQKLIDDSYDNWRTRKYDDYQFKTNGILP